MAAKKSKLTPVLAKRASVLAEAARARLSKQAREDIALVKRRKTEFTEALYDLGEALLRLRKDPIPKLLGDRGFSDLCQRGLDLSPTNAGKVIEIVERLPRRDALKWGKEKAHALIELADATPAADTPLKIDAKALGEVDPKRATVRELQALAQKERGKKKAAPRGRTTTKEERELAARLQSALRKSGAKTATAAAVATKPGAPAKLRIEVPSDRLDDLRGAITAVHRRR
ncbi:MAG: hypothetical protein HYV09_35555 [Deltaproteobacteria bacterium]|nr:hypothetical protein [Deltaproteobacteria bacterium]